MGLCNVVHVGSCCRNCMDIAGARVRTGMDLHTEVPRIPLLRGAHFRIAGFRGVLVAFLVELGAWMMVASTIVPPCMMSPAASSRSFTSSNILRVMSCFSSRCRKCRSVVASGVRSMEKSIFKEALHGVAVVDCILESLVRKTEPVLHEVHAQHRFQWNQFSAALFLDIERRNECHPFVPRNNGLHGTQKGFSSCCSFAVCVFHVRKCLLHHDVASLSSCYCFPLL